MCKIVTTNWIYDKTLNVQLHFLPKPWNFTPSRMVWMVTFCKSLVNSNEAGSVPWGICQTSIVASPYGRWLVQWKIWMTNTSHVPIQIPSSYEYGMEVGFLTSCKAVEVPFPRPWHSSYDYEMEVGCPMSRKAVEVPFSRPWHIGIEFGFQVPMNVEWRWGFQQAGKQFTTVSAATH